MTRIEAIARLRELADRLEAASDAPHDGHGGFTPELALFTDYAKPDHQNSVADYWIERLGTAKRTELESSVVYRDSILGSDGRIAVFVSDKNHQPHDDLLSNRDVSLIEIGGAA